MVVELPPSFRDCQVGQRINVVAKLRVWDPCHDSHLFWTSHDNVSFLASGLIDGSGDVYSLLNAEFRRQFPIPVLQLDDHSKVLRHDRPSWNSLHEVVELCAGFGGMTQGMLTSGFRPVVAVDFNEKMMHLYGQQSQADRITGDVNSLSTLKKIWDLSKGAGTLAAGFACQPFSLLGDQKGGADPRAQCLKAFWPLHTCCKFMQSFWNVSFPLLRTHML